MTADPTRRGDPTSYDEYHLVIKPGDQFQSKTLGLVTAELGVMQGCKGFCCHETHHDGRIVPSIPAEQNGIRRPTVVQALDACGLIEKKEMIGHFCRDFAANEKYSQHAKSRRPIVRGSRMLEVTLLHAEWKRTETHGVVHFQDTFK